MPWRDDPRTPPYWIEFAALILRYHPEWEPFVQGPIDGHRSYPAGDRRFYVEIASEHPTICEPLTIEVADQVPGGPIDLYWNGYFEHVFCGGGWGQWREQVAHAARRVEDWTSDEFVFKLRFDRETGKRAHTHRRTEDGKLLPVTGARTLEWSWRGTHDFVDWNVDAGLARG